MLMVCMSSNPTRTNGLKIYKNHCNKILEDIFFHRESNELAIPYETVDAPDLLLFKTQLAR